MQRANPLDLSHLTADQREALREKLLARRTVNPATECWEWAGATNEQGYGIMRLAGALQRVHRVSYALFVGALPARKVACHRCDNPRCFNPAHLRADTQRNNMIEMIRKGRARQWGRAVPADPTYAEHAA